MAKRTKKTEAPAATPETQNTAPVTPPVPTVAPKVDEQKPAVVTVNEKELVEYFRKAILGSAGTTGHAAKSAFKKITGREWA